MSQIDFDISPKIFETFPKCRVGGLVVQGLDNVWTSDQKQLIDESAEHLKRKNIDTAKLPQDPRIVAWRQTMRQQRLKPADIRKECSSYNWYNCS